MSLMIESCQITISGKQYQVNLADAIDISITMKPGSDNPNCYYTDPVQIETIKADGFTGSVAEGGACNHRRITMAPHGNGTHTECYGHVVDQEDATLDKCLRRFYFGAQLLTVQAQPQVGDLVIGPEQVMPFLIPEVPSLVIRTMPNENIKRTHSYSGTNPAYIDPALARELNHAGIKHLLVDLPSVDREQDQGVLASHKAFWGIGSPSVRTECTITELIYVPSEVPDGVYLLSLQVMNLQNDAAPSRPMLFPLIS